MKRLGLLPVHLGVATSTLLTREVCDFYIWLATLLENTRWDFSQTETRLALALDNAAIEQNAPAILDLFTERLLSRVKTSELIVADLATRQNGMLRGGILIHLARAIQTALKEVAGARIVVILPELPPIEDLFRVALNSYTENCRVVLVGANGDAVGAPPSFKPKNFFNHFARLSEDPLARFKSKLVRRLGHYKIRLDRQHRYCRRFFYDGGYCTSELVLLFGQHIRRLYSSAIPGPVLWEPPVSRWLEDALIVFDNEGQYEQLDVSTFASESVPQYTGNLPLLIVPAVYSGRSLEQLLVRIARRHPGLTVNVLAILSSLDDHRSRSSTFEAAGRSWPFSHLVKVEQEEFGLGKCEMCKLAIPESKPARAERFAMLTSYDFWQLVKKSGWKMEEDVPSHRESLGMVPRFPELIDDNGPWLASKFMLVLESHFGTPPLDLVIICPDEKGSRSFTDFLQHVFNVTVVRVPRPVLKSFGKDKRQRPQWRKRYQRAKPDWYVQMSSIRRGAIILLDEFNASGGTRRQLSALVRAFDLDVGCYFSITDWDPSRSAMAEVPTLALYGFEAFGTDEESHSK